MTKILYHKGSKTFYKFPNNTFDGRYRKGDVVRVLNEVPKAWNNRYVIIEESGKIKSYLVSKKRETLVYLFDAFSGIPKIKTGTITINGFLSLVLWKKGKNIK